MNEIITLLNNIEDSYFDFISAVTRYAEKNDSRKAVLLAYLKDHPDAKSSDVVKFVSDQPDFYEDAAYMQVG